MNDIQDNAYAGIPYDDINWYDIDGQPFGTASYFNAMILEDANNIVDTKGAMAVGGNFTSQRGLSLGYGNNSDLGGTGYSPNLVRFLVGGDVAMQGPLVVIGHVVANGNFKAARGSTYMIGKDASDNQSQTLSDLYQADGGSRYWKPSDRGNHYAVSSFDVPRYIPAERIQADTGKFFRNAKESISKYQNCIINLTPNGTVTQHYAEWILKGDAPGQNVFVIDVRPNGIIDKEIRFETPRDSIAIVILRTGEHAHLKYGLWGAKALANRTIYVFEDAKHIHMEVPAAIYGSILAPQAQFHAHPTGGTVYGNAVLRALEVKPGSGFEFHLHPFIGGIVCRPVTQAPVPTPLPAPVVEEAPEELVPPPEEAPVETPTPETEVPEQVLPPPEEAPEVIPIREQPQRKPPVLPYQPVVPPQIPTPCPECPPQRPCPVAAPCPETPPQMPCPEATPCPECPPQSPCPAAAPCPQCPPERPDTVRLQPVPIPIPILYPGQCECEECQITPGLIYGCIWGCECGKHHEWEVTLYQKQCDRRKPIHCVKICGSGCFEFKVPYDGYYILVVRSHRSSRRCCKCKASCRPCISLKNVGVANLMIE